MMNCVSQYDYREELVGFRMAPMEDLLPSPFSLNSTLTSRVLRHCVKVNNVNVVMLEIVHSGSFQRSYNVKKGQKGLCLGLVYGVMRE